MGHEEVHRANPRSSFVVCLWLVPLCHGRSRGCARDFEISLPGHTLDAWNPRDSIIKKRHLLCSLAGPVNSFSRLSRWSVRKAFLDRQGNLGCVSSSGPWAVLKNKAAPTCLAEQRCWIQVWIKDSWTTVTLRCLTTTVPEDLGNVGILSVQQSFISLCINNCISHGLQKCLWSSFAAIIK